MTIAIDQLHACPVSLQSIIFSKLSQLLSVCFGLSLFDFLLQFVIAVDLEVSWWHCSAHGALLFMLPKVANAVHAEGVLAREGTWLNHGRIADVALAIKLVFVMVLDRSFFLFFLGTHGFLSCSSGG